MGPFQIITSRFKWGQFRLAVRAAGLLVAERQFHRVKGYKEIPFLVTALNAHVAKVSEAGARVA